MTKEETPWREFRRGLLDGFHSVAWSERTVVTMIVIGSAIGMTAYFVALG